MLSKATIQFTNNNHYTFLLRTGSKINLKMMTKVTNLVIVLTCFNKKVMLRENMHVMNYYLKINNFFYRFFHCFWHLSVTLTWYLNEPWEVWIYNVFSTLPSWRAKKTTSKVVLLFGGTAWKTRILNIDKCITT